MSIFFFPKSYSCAAIYPGTVNLTRVNCSHHQVQCSVFPLRQYSNILILYVTQESFSNYSIMIYMESLFNRHNSIEFFLDAFFLLQSKAFRTEGGFISFCLSISCLFFHLLFITLNLLIYTYVLLNILMQLPD